jgi:uncharacterized membrane protein
MAISEISAPSRMGAQQPDGTLQVPTRDPFPLGIAVRALATFALVGASVGLFVSSVGVIGDAFEGFLDRNALSKESRLLLLLGFAAGLVLGVAAALIYLALRGRRGVLTLQRAANVILPLSLAFLLPSFFSAKPWHSKPLPYLVGLTTVVLLLEQLLRRSLVAWPSEAFSSLARKLTPSPRVARLLPLCIVLAGSLWYSIYFSYYTILNHHRLGTSGFDLGININWCYNALNGHWFRSSVLFGADGGHFFSGHAIFAMILWLPLFALMPGGEILLIFQATMVGFAATTLYLFASTQIPRWSAVVLAWAFLLFAPLHGPTFYDYHELLPPLFFHFLLYWAIATNRNRWVLVLVPVLWSFREDVAVGLTVLGLFLALTGIRARLGLVLAGASVAWFILIKFVLMPSWGQWWFASIYKELQPPGESGYGAVVQTLLLNPGYTLSTLLREEKLIYFLHMFGPLALLPARRLALVLLAIPGFFFSLLTTGYPPTVSIAFQYTCHSIPYLFAASVLALRVLGKGEAGIVRRRAALGAMALGVLSHSYVFGAALQHETFIGGFSKIEFEMTPKERQRYHTIQRLNAMIPKDASVSATENEVPHVAARLTVYTLKDGGIPADYVLLNKLHFGMDNSRKGFTQMLEREPYGLVAKGDDLYLFKRHHVSPETDQALSALGVKSRRRRGQDQEKGHDGDN